MRHSTLLLLILTAGLLSGPALPEHVSADEPSESPTERATSFEQATPGELRRVETSAGTFIAEADHAEIDAAHARTGKQCLHLFGGEERSVEFVPRASEKPLAFLAFHAERWTRRAPFVFRVSAFDGESWSELYQGDDTLRIGGFLTHVMIPLTKTPERFRITCTSPEKSGVLIDDLELVPATKQRVTSVTVEDHVVPIFAGAKRVPVLRIVVEASGTLEPLRVVGFDTTLSTLNSIDWVDHLSSGQRPDLTQAVALTKGPPLKHGRNDFWMTVDAERTVDLDSTFTAQCESVRFSDGITVKAQQKFVRPHRFGVAVRSAGQDGVHTSRIPGLATTNAGTLIGVYDLRHRSGGDLPGDIDVGMSRSTNGGKTWEPARTIIDMGDDPEFRYDGVGDPSILVDRKTGTIWVAAVWSHGNRGWHGSGPGLTPEETGQFVLVRSDDDGKTWSEPINITEQIKKPEWCFLLQGPGKGIVLEDGTLVFPAQYQDTLTNKRLPHSTMITSRDHGKTWEIGTGAFSDTTEAQVVERARGELMLNARYNRASTRVVMTSRDLGRSWTEHATSRETLTEPRACMASLINVDRELGLLDRGRLLFSNPASLTSRSRMTIRASSNGGETWSDGLLLDADRSAGYSCLTMIDAETVGILYEGSRAHMTFQRVPLAELFPETE